MIPRILIIGALSVLAVGCSQPSAFRSVSANDPTNISAVEAPLPLASKTLQAVAAQPPSDSMMPAAATQPDMQQNTPRMDHGMKSDMDGMSNMQHPMPVSAPVAGQLYTCRMHPQVVSDKEGNCPICGMKLVLKTEGIKP